MLGEEKIEVGERVRDVCQAADGTVSILTDSQSGKLPKQLPQSFSGCLKTLFSIQNVIMPQFIPELSSHTLKLMNTGEQKVARFLQTHLSGESIVWWSIPTGKKRLYADFLVLIPNKGLLCLEVKDWKLDILRRINSTECEIMLEGSLKTIKHPLEQSREYIHNIINMLVEDPRLRQQNGDYRGRLKLPYAFGVVFSNFSYDDITRYTPDTAKLGKLLPLKQILYKNDLSARDTAQVELRLNDMFAYDFGCTLNKEEINLIRWHLFPEIRINTAVQQDLFLAENDEQQLISKQKEAAPLPRPIVAPDIVKIMDIQQEQLARSMGGGHRVIHGVAGSGKTLILGIRSQYLAEQSNKPVLVLCYNIALAAKLRALIADKGLAEKVQVHHFHGWCSDLLKAHHIPLLSEKQKLPFYERSVQALVRAMQEKTLPENLYGAVLIDEGHDFDPDWLRLAVYTLDQDEGNLLLLYDDAQSIYKRGSLGFSLASVGIKAQGRTTVLRLNYRNTKEIIGFAYLFAQNKMQPRESSENEIPLLEPEAAGESGVSPYLRKCDDWPAELDFLAGRLDKWLTEGLVLQDIAVICHESRQCDDVCELLKRKDIPHQALQKSSNRKKYHPKTEAITVCTMHSSKGLEFQRVMLMGIDTLKDKTDQQEEEGTRLLYVTMTRAQSYLMITLSGENLFVQRLQHSYRQFKENYTKSKK